MTQPSVPPLRPEEFVLHPSIAIGWWLDYLPYARQSMRFRSDHMLSARVTLSCVQGIEFHVLDVLARELAKEQLGVLTAWPLADDVFQTFRTLIEDAVLTQVSNRMLARGAFQIAAHYGLPFADALYVALARGR